MEGSNLHVFSEVGRLRTLMLHKPSKELDNLTPSIMKRLLFDDIPDAVQAAQEYDAYIKILHDCGVNTIFVEDLVAEAVDAAGIKETFLSEFLDFSEPTQAQKEVLMRYFLDMDTHAMIDKLIIGLRKEEAPEGKHDLFAGIGGKEEPLILDPLPNLYFTRDPFIILGNCVSISKMFYPARQRETIFARTIFKHHPIYKNEQVIINDQPESYIEGGDILLLDEETLAIGLSQRTSSKAIQHLATQLFQSEGNKHLKHVLAFRIPATRAFMHLDTVFTMLDRDCFVVHSAIEETLQVTDLTWKDGQLHAEEEEGSLEDILKKHLALDKVKLIPCGGGSAIDGEREQWTDGSNTLAVGPGEIIVYDRNYVTNDLFEEAGLKLHKIPCAEISRGRGGPHCMSMPFVRDLLD